MSYINVLDFHIQYELGLADPTNELEFKAMEHKLE